MESGVGWASGMRRGERRSATARVFCVALWRAQNSHAVSRCANLSSLDAAAHNRLRAARSLVASAVRSLWYGVGTQADRNQRGALRVSSERWHLAFCFRRRTAIALARRDRTETRL